MNTYKTAQLARLVGVHPNTVRLYETLGLIPPADRQPNGYRVFCDFHLEQFRLAQLGLRVEVLQNGLRKQVIVMIKTAARGQLQEATRLNEEYLQRIWREQRHAEAAMQSAEQLLKSSPAPQETCLTRRQAAAVLGVSIDALRNWEMNGLLKIKRRANGYRVYAGPDMQRLAIIRSLRCANYSLAAILRMMAALERNPKADLRRVIDTPAATDEIITACDKLLTSLRAAEQNARAMQQQLAVLGRLNF